MGRIPVEHPDPPSSIANLPLPKMTAWAMFNQRSSALSVAHPIGPIGVHPGTPVLLTARKDVRCSARWGRVKPARRRRSRGQCPDAPILLVGFFQLFNAWPDRGRCGCAVFYRSENPPGLSRIFASDQNAVIQFDPGFARILDLPVISLEPIAQPNCALLLGSFEGGLEVVGNTRQLSWIDRAGDRVLFGGFLLI